MRTATSKQQLTQPVLQLTLQGLEKFEGLPTAVTLRRWVRLALVDAKQAAQLTLRFVDSREGRRLNREFRQRDYATNVLTFDYARKPCLEADIVFCIPVVAREARLQKKTLRAHLAHMVIHGVLHARGYDHLTDAQARRMEAVERQLLATLRIADPYATDRSVLA